MGKRGRVHGKKTNELRVGEMSFGLTEQSTCETRKLRGILVGFASEISREREVRLVAVCRCEACSGRGRKRVSDGAAFANFGKFCLRVGTYPRAENSDVWTKKEEAAAVTPFPL